MNQVKFLRAKSLDILETEVNEFCKEHDVFATQFLQQDDAGFIVAVWYREGSVKL